MRIKFSSNLDRVEFLSFVPNSYFCINFGLNVLNSFIENYLNAKRDRQKIMEGYQKSRQTIHTECLIGTGICYENDIIALTLFPQAPSSTGP